MCVYVYVLSMCMCVVFVCMCMFLHYIYACCICVYRIHMCILCMYMYKYVYICIFVCVVYMRGQRRGEHCLGLSYSILFPEVDFLTKMCISADRQKASAVLCLTVLGLQAHIRLLCMFGFELRSWCMHSTVINWAIVPDFIYSLCPLHCINRSQTVN